jgi:hypothetical protein
MFANLFIRETIRKYNYENINNLYLQMDIIFLFGNIKTYLYLCGIIKHSTLVRFIKVGY